METPNFSENQEVASDDSATNKPTPDYSSLSHDELVAWIDDLVAKISELETQNEELKTQIAETQPQRNDWHSWLEILLNILLYRFFKDNVKIFPEFKLGAMPPRLDFLIVQDGDLIDLGLDVFKIFNRYNIIEFKNPHDDLSIDVLWKVVAYAALFINRDRVSSDEVTLTLIRAAKPVQLFGVLKKAGAVIEEGPTKGIYIVKNWKVDFPIQIIVSAELKGEEYAIFRTISKKPSTDDIKLIMRWAENESDPVIKQFLRDYLEMLSEMDRDVVNEAKGRDPEMAKAWREIFGVDEEINTAVSSARADERRTNLYLYVQNGTMTVDNAARNAGISTEEFQSGMNNYINSQQRQQQLQTV